VKHCLDYAKDQNDDESIAYFSEVSEEYDYISIDGNNSSSAIHHFLKDEIKAKHPSSGKNKKFSSFTEVEQKEIEYVDKITIIDLRQISYKGMCYLFRNLNTQTKLKPQEYRQAMPTKLSRFIREVSNTPEVRKMFTDLVCSGPADLDQRSHEEMVAKYCLKVKSGYIKALSKLPLDTMYEVDLDLSREVKDKCTHVLEEVAKISNKVGNQAKKLKVGLVFALFDLVNIIEEEDYQILDYLSLYANFLEFDALMSKNSQSVPQSKLKQESYLRWIQLHNDPVCYNRFRFVIEQFFSLEVQNLIDTKVIKKRRSSSDMYSFEDKKTLYVLQNARDRHNDKINILDLYFGKYEADHVISVSDGGETVLENAELMKKEDNRKKGSSSNDPFFKHQVDFGF
tara:strand:- start:135 stop:1325 length:1191 start_codon:yes stop_codon:yes gene_type:complete